MRAVTVNYITCPVCLFDDSFLPVLDVKDLLAEPVEVGRLQPYECADDRLVDIRLPGQPEPESVREVFPGDSVFQDTCDLPRRSTYLVEVHFADFPAGSDLPFWEVHPQHHVRYVGEAEVQIRGDAGMQFQRVELLPQRLLEPLQETGWLPR